MNSAYEKDQVLMYDDTRDDDELKLGNPKLHIEVNAAGTLDFELPSTNVAYSRIVPMVTELHVVKDNQKTHDKHIWFGRVLTIDTDLYGTKTCHCEGGLAYLNDCIYYDKSVDVGSWSSPRTVGRALFARYKSPTLNENGFRVYGVSPQEASAVIANIMSGGSNYKENLKAPFKHLGRIAKYVDPKDNVSVYAWVNEPVVPSGDQNDDDYYFDEDNLDSTVQKQCGITNPNNLTAIDLISSMMNNVGGLFWVSKTPYYPKSTLGDADLGDAVYVMQLHMRRYYPAFNSEEGQTIQLGENLTDLTITDDGTTFFTAVHPHGQRPDSGEDFTLRRGGVLTGTTYINKRTWKIDPDHGVMYCPELVEQYGMIIRDLDVGTTNMYEQLVGLSISEIDSIPLISKTVGGSWTSGLRELTVKGIDLSLYNVDYSSIELTDAVRVLAPRHGIDTYLNTTAIDYDLQNVENTVFTLNAIKSSNEINNASPSYSSSSGSSSSASAYVHPKHTEHNLGLYKFSNDNLGHVDSAVAVSKKDITALGIPSENTKYYASSSRNPDAHGVTLTDSKGNTTVAPLETYRRTLPLKSYSDDGEYVNGRGYLIYTTGFQIKSEYGRFDASHPLNIEGKYTLSSDQIDHEWNINGDVTASGNTVILNLKTDTADSDLSLNVYAYGYFEKAVDGHEYILYHIWIAVYISKDLTGLSYTATALSSIQYTDMEGLYLQSPPDSDHAIDYSKLVKQTENDSDENTKYELSKTGSTITLTGSDGSSSSVTDSDTTYELIRYDDVHDGIYPDGPVVSLKDSYEKYTEITVPRVMTYSSWDPVYRVNHGNLSLGGNRFASLVDIVYHRPESFHGDGPITIDTFCYIKVFAVYHHAYVKIIVYQPNDVRAIIYPPSVLSGPDIKWTLLSINLGPGFDVEDGVYQTFQICVDQETMKKIYDVRANARLIYTTSENGELLKKAQNIDKVNTYLGEGGEIKNTQVILTSRNASDVAFTGDYNDLSNKPTIPDISGKQDKSTAVTHTANTAVGSATKPVYVAANGAATAISHSINADVPANAKFTDTTYNDATQSAHGLMTAADKKKLDGMDLSKYLPRDGTAKKAELLSSGQMRTAYCHNDDANFSNGYVWFKIGTAIVSGGYRTITTTFLGICGYGSHALYTCRIRLTSAGNAIESIRFSESGRTSGMQTGLFRVVATNGEKNVTFELWAKAKSRWEGTRVVILNEMNLYGVNQSNFWTLTSRDNADAKTAPTSGNMHVNSSDSSICATAAKATEATTLTDSGWVNCPLVVTGNTTYPTSASTIRVRKYGKMVKLEGRVKYAKAFNNGHNVATIPDGYRPESQMELIGVPSAGSGTNVLFYVSISAGGNISFSPADSAGSVTFNPAMSYDFQATYFID